MIVTVMIKRIEYLDAKITLNRRSGAELEKRDNFP